MLLKKSSPLALSILFVATTGLALSFAPSCSTVADCPVGVDCAVGGAGGGDAGAGGEGVTSSAGGAGGAGGSGGNGGVGGASTCDNGVKDGDEGGIDCGGMECAGCLNDPCSTGADCATGTCGGMPMECVCPPGMVSIASSGGFYCIDSYEVTNEAYAVFRDAAVGGMVQKDRTPECSWNDEVTPVGGFLMPLDRPVVGIDWCDARTYCKWNGKRLCGAVGGGQSGFDDYTMAGSSAWFNACSLGGAIAYPYTPPDYNAATCNGDGDANPASIGSLTVTACVGSVAGLFHMSGNVAEWEDSCEISGAGGAGGMGGVGGMGGMGGAGGAGGGGPDEKLVPCRTRGGSFNSGEGALHCAADASSPRNTTADDLGFRCCL